MKIEVGKLYKTRNGLKVRIYAADGGFAAQRIHGAHQNESIVGWACCSWREDGCYYADSEHEFDIVDLWPEQDALVSPSTPAGRLQALTDLSDALGLYSDEAVEYISTGKRSHPLYIDKPQRSED